MFCDQSATLNACPPTACRLCPSSSRSRCAASRCAAAMFSTCTIDMGAASALPSDGQRLGPKHAATLLRKNRSSPAPQMCPGRNEQVASPGRCASSTSFSAAIFVRW